MRTVKEKQRNRRHSRIRARVSGTFSRPRLSVYRSNKFIYAQIIDDDTGATLVSATDKVLEGKVVKSGGTKEKKAGKRSAAKKLNRAKAVGEAVANLAKEKQITKVVFDRGGFLYAGRVKALAEGAREGGLEF